VSDALAAGESTATRPPAWRWRLAVSVFVGMAAGYLAGRALGYSGAAAQSAVVAAFTVAAGSKGRLSTSLPVAAVLGVIVVVYSTIGALTTGYPVAAALAMAAVAFTTSVMTAARPVGLLIGMVASYAYFLVTGFGVIAESTIGNGLSNIGILGLIGLGAGLILVAARALVEQAIGTAPDAAPRSASPSLLAPMIASVRSFDDEAKDGVRRAIALGLAMFGFQAIANHSAFWIMLTVFIVLQPNGRSTVSQALIRVTGTFVGVMAVVIVAPLLPESLVTPLAVLCIGVSLAVASRSSTLSVAFGAVAASVLAGLPHADILGYAGERLIDTLIGAAIALAAGYLLWPRTRPTPEPVPDGLAAAASVSGISGA
jgi:Fusaric acid resistance protein-like